MISKETTRISKCAKLAALDAHKALTDAVSSEFADDEGEEAIAALVTAVSALYDGILEAVIDKDDARLAKLAFNLFMHSSADTMKKVAALAS